MKGDINRLSATAHQKNIYTLGASGIRSKIPLDGESLERRASQIMSQKAFDYVATGAGTEQTVLANRSDFDNYRIIPRVLQNVENRSCESSLLSSRIPFPFFLSPVGVLEMAHSSADLGVAQACARTGTPVILSNQASVPMEQCAKALGDTPWWFQLYWSQSDELVKSLVSRAENSGAQAIVITLDTTLLGWRNRDLNNAYLPFIEGKGIAQYTSDPYFQTMLDQFGGHEDSSPNISLSSLGVMIKLAKSYPGNFWANLFSKRPLRAVQLFIQTYSRPSLEWKDIMRIREWTQLPIILKGILHADDAEQAYKLGLDGIIVSNHGGRQVDGAISSLSALISIRERIGSRYPILLDGGVRSGADIFKAIALGATAVGIGRPYAYALAIDGPRGVEQLIRNYHADFELTMALSGVAEVQNVNPECLKKKG